FNVFVGDRAVIPFLPKNTLAPPLVLILTLSGTGLAIRAGVKPRNIWTWPTPLVVDAACSVAPAPSSMEPLLRSTFSKVILPLVDVSAAPLAKLRSPVPATSEMEPLLAVIWPALIPEDPVTTLKWVPALPVTNPKRLPWLTSTALELLDKLSPPS